MIRTGVASAHCSDGEARIEYPAFRTIFYEERAHNPRTVIG